MTPSTEPTEARRTLAEGLQKVLVPPLEPEELYTMSERLDVVMNRAKNVVRDSEAVGWHRTPRPRPWLRRSWRAPNISRLRSGASGATRRAPAGAPMTRPTACERPRRRIALAMVALKDADIDDAFTLITTYEAYRGYVAVGEAIVHVAHRIWYAMLRAT